jgi:hypothetical protein
MLKDFYTLEGLSPTLKFYLHKVSFGAGMVQSV